MLKDIIKAEYMFTHSVHTDTLFVFGFYVYDCFLSSLSVSLNKFHNHINYTAHICKQILNFYYIRSRTWVYRGHAAGRAVGWGTVLQARR
jgi:hypothetical protein